MPNYIHLLHFLFVLYLVFSLLSHGTWFQHPRDRFFSVAALVMRCCDGIGGRFHLRYALRARGSSLGLQNSRHHRTHWCGHLFVRGAVRELTLLCGHHAISVLCQHPIHRGRLLVRTNLYCGALHGPRMWCHEHGRKLCWHRCRAIDALFGQSRWLGIGALYWDCHGICRGFALVVYQSRPTFHPSICVVIHHLGCISHRWTAAKLREPHGSSLCCVQHAMLRSAPQRG